MEAGKPKTFDTLVAAHVAAPSVRRDASRLVMKLSKALSLAAFIAFFSFAICLAYFRLTYEPISVNSPHISAGLADTPYQYRVLSPFVIMSLYRVATDWGATYLGVTFFVHLFTMFFLFVAFNLYLRQWFDPAWAFAGVAALALCILSHGLQTAVFTRIAYVAGGFHGERGNSWRSAWDITQIGVYLALAYFVVKRRIVWWYLAFAAGTLNKETTIAFVPALIVLWTKDIGWKRAASHTVASVFIFVAIKSALWFAFPGKVSLVYLMDNLRSFVLGDWRIYLTLALTFGGLWIFIPYGLRGCPAVPRKLFVAVAPLFAAGQMWGADIPEIRVFNELSIIVIPVALSGIIQILRADDESAAEIHLTDKKTPMLD